MLTRGYLVSLLLKSKYNNLRTANSTDLTCFMLGLNYMHPKALLIIGGTVATASGDESERNLPSDPGL